ncbi:prephenate dehydrogenase/arogenate dehydrogenase family protein [Kitasatospora sp. NPDC006786]|uniref:prephenate dehydrogenase/arogenate dehydrogenase family protein n=1 Tax=unclassified Kitasatospora TaxID=2633591 RepID=UPI0033E25C44
MSGTGVRSLRRCLVAGGAGAVGGMFASLLAGSGAEVVVVDPAGGDIAGDITSPGGALVAELGKADLVLLAVPERTGLAAIPLIAPHLRPGALLVDTLSVKDAVVTALQGVEGVQAVSLNPMFAPALGMPGKPVATVVVHDGPAAAELLRLLAEWGGRPVLLDAERHDRLTAAAQVLTHASVLGFGLALEELGTDIGELGEIAPPPHATLLALLARIASGTPEVYWDIQVANPDAARARGALAASVRRLADLIDGGDEAGFAAAQGRLRDLFGTALDEHRDTCAHLFDALSASTRIEAT